jgi:hypothetical protein
LAAKNLRSDEYLIVSAVIGLECHPACIYPDKRPLSLHPESFHHIYFSSLPLIKCQSTIQRWMRWTTDHPNFMVARLFVSFWMPERLRSPPLFVPSCQVVLSSHIRDVTETDVDVTVSATLCSPHQHYTFTPSLPFLTPRFSAHPYNL